MTTMIANASVREICLGINVSRATAALPATALGNIFTISGGRIIAQARPVLADISLKPRSAATLLSAYAPSAPNASSSANGPRPFVEGP